MPQTPVSQDLRYARGLIDRGWTQHAIARDSSGIETEPEAETAVSWCTTGACFASTPVPSDMLFVLASEVPPAGRCRDGSLINVLTRWNDHPARTHQDVRALFDRAIDRLETGTRTEKEISENFCAFP